MHSSITKRVISLALLVVATIPVAVAAQSNVKQITIHTGINIRVDGQLTQMTDANGHPVEVFEYNGTTYVPLRGVAQSMGADISYDAGTRTASVNSPASTEINPSYEALNQLYRATNEMYKDSSSLFSICLRGNVSNIDPLICERNYQTNLSRYESACIAAMDVSPSDDFYTEINEIVSYLDTVKYNYDKTYEVFQNGIFTQTFLERMSTYDIDGGYAASMALIMCNGLLDQFD